MVLTQDTPVILMDEPTTYLDINHQFELLRLIRGLGDTAAAVFDSHAIDRVFGVISEAVTDSVGQRHDLFREA